jgi:hypothetical protein
MSLYHVYSQTVADGTATSLVRPSDWNSAHRQQITLSGNTAGNSTLSGTNIVFQGGNNVTLSGVNVANAATIIVSGVNTVAQTVQTQAAGNIAGTAFNSTTTTGTAIVATVNNAGLSMGVPAFLTTQSVQTQASGAIARTGFTSTTTAGTAITAALGTNGLSMSVPQFITTYVNDLTSGRAGTGTTLALTNLSGTLSVNTNGVALSLNNPDDHFYGWNLVGNTAGTTSTSLTTEAPIYFSGGNNITLSGNSNTIVIQGAAGGGGGGGIALQAGTQTATSGTVVFSNANGVTFGMSNSSVVTASIIANNTYDGWPPYADLQMVAGQQGQGTLYFEPENSPYYFQDRVGIPIAYTNASNSNGTLTLSYWVGFYTQNASTLSLSASTSISTAFTFNGTTGTHWSLHSGMRLLTIPWSLTVAEQEIYIAQVSRTSTGGNNASISQMLVSQVASNFVGFFGQSHNTTQQWTQGQGVYSVTTSGLPNSVAFSQIRGSDSIALRAPAIMFINSTV